MSAIRSRNPGGLPPAPRSRSVGRDREPDSRDYSRRPPMPAQPRQIRPQRSLASIQPQAYAEPRERSRSRAPPLPATPRTPRSESRRPPQPQEYARGHAQDDYRPGRVQSEYKYPRGREDDAPHGRAPEHYARRSDASSASSASAASEVSSGSSFLDRMRLRSGASSRTSWEEERAPSVAKGGWPRDRRPAKEEPQIQVEEYDDEPITPGAGSSLWSRLAETASTLTVSAGKAWAANVPTYSGEETPSGQESHLTRAMKAYHLEKARDPSDLPEWLFDERERRPVGRASDRRRRDDRDDNYDDRYERSAPAAPQPQRRGGLRDIYDSYERQDSRMPTPRSDSRPPPSRSAMPARDEGAAPSKANDRLKAIRDAKRKAATGSSISDRGEPPPSSSRRTERQDERGYGSERVYGSERGYGSAQRRPPPVQGLPSRPGGERRF